eukprot:TRINITY_DN199_c0_g1_i1.p13 TRINITY_DN199_c0_g1~~TRINITY_DN199_c0_g1_i1.p13  ORF type:complete len:173 (-),score=22.03 TRINITY_DN199_c0_g1_i1:5472-5990(-)
MCDVQFSFGSCHPFDDSLSALQTIRTWSSTYSLDPNPSRQLMAMEKQEEEMNNMCGSPVAALVKNKAMEDMFDNVSYLTPQNKTRSPVDRTTDQATPSKKDNHKISDQSAVLIELGKCLARLGVGIEAARAAGLLHGFDPNQVEVVRQAHQHQINKQKLQELYAAQVQACRN